MGNLVIKLVLALFGNSWKTTIIGYGGAALIELAAQLAQQPGPVWHVVALIVAALGRAAKDANVTHSAPTGNPAIPTGVRVDSLRG